MAISENKEIKFTEEELKSLSELSTEYQRTQLFLDKLVYRELL